MSEHYPEETMAVVASDLDRDDLPDELIDELLADARTPAEITGPDGLLQRLTKRLVEQAMAAELSRAGRATPATASLRRRSTPSTARSGSSSRATARVASSRRSCRGTSAASKGSTSGSSACTGAG